MAVVEYKFKPFELVHYSFSKLPNNRNYPKMDHGIACNDEYLITYEFGRIPEELLSTDVPVEYKNGTLWKYHLITCHWEKIKCKNLPTYFKFNSIILSGNLVIIHGGGGSRFSNNCIYQTFIGNLSKENQDDGSIEFEEIPSTNGIPKNGYGQPIVMNGQFIYTVNGRSVDNLESEHELDVYRLDLSEKKWEVLYVANSIHTYTDHRFKHEVAYYDKRLFMFSRAQLDIEYRNIPNPQMFKKIYVFNLTLNEWQYIDMLPDESSFGYPENRIHYSWAQDMSQKEYIYMSGGFNEKVFLRDIWRLNLITLKWLNLSPCVLPKPAFFHSCTITQFGRMYYLDGIIGSFEPGRCCVQSERLTQNHGIMSVWTQIPKLKTICWDAMLYYFKHQMLALSENGLRELGLPLDCCKKITNATKI